MIKILKHLGKHKLQVIIIIVMLFVQVYCDLALPQYTSDIVDVGIQQGGIESGVPEYISEDTLNQMGMFFEADQYKKIKGQYELDDSFKPVNGYKGNVYKLTGKRDLSKVMEEAFGGQIPEGLAKQATVEVVKAEYEKIGVDMDSLQMSYLWNKGIIMVALTLLMILAAIVVGYFASKVGAQIGRDTRKQVFTKVLSFGHREMDKFGSASLITRTTNDIQQVQMVIVVLLRMVMMAPIMGIGACLKVVGTKTGMGWIVGCAVGIILIVVATLMAISMPKFKKMQTLIDKVNLVSREIITGIPVIRAFSRERHEEERFDMASKDLMKTQIFTHRTMAFMMPTMMLIMNVITLGIVWFGADGIDQGNLQVGDMMAFITYTMQVVISFMLITMAAIMIPRAAVAAERIDAVLKTQPSIVDPEEPKKIENPKGLVKFDKVHFRYDEATDDALEGITFTAEPGKTTAIIGSTGSGKTTLVNMIPRFFDVTAGQITIDGIDIREMSQHDLRDMIGYVPQKGVLFSGDISSNIKFASSEISDEKMVEAAEISQSMEFIEEKEEKFQSPIAQGGTNVSGGQKQRLSIARAIAKSPKIYIFDDSFSALDYKTDTKLRKMLFQKTGDSTVIIVAQRIATILRADKIIVLDEGRIVGEGTHGQLLKECETYREIASSQLSEEELAKGVC